MDYNTADTLHFCFLNLLGFFNILYHHFNYNYQGRDFKEMSADLSAFPWLLRERKYEKPQTNH